MRIPYTVNKNILSVYVFLQKSHKQDGRLHSDNFKWDEAIPKSLREICIEVIASNWQANPIINELQLLSDRLLLLEILPIDLPLELSAKKINYGIYWKRCYKSRWSKLLPQDPPAEEAFPSYYFERKSSFESSQSSLGSNTSQAKRLNSSEENVNFDVTKKTWKQCYMEMHVCEYLANLKPEEYDPEKIKILCDICGPYVINLTLSQMRAPEESSSDHIPLHSILVGFKNLTTLSICFQQTYVEDSFSWHIFRTSMQDISYLSKGIEKTSLTILRIVKSDIDCEKFSKILMALRKAESLKEIDFSHCKISDKGALIASNFLVEHSHVEIVNLSNNKIGSKGAKGFAYVLSQPSCGMTDLNLCLNQINSPGGNIIIETLTNFGKSLNRLTLAGCRFKNDLKIRLMLEKNNTLNSLDISSNKLGEIKGIEILQGMELNSTITKLDLRMCGITEETKFAIHTRIGENRDRKTRKVEMKLENEEQLNVELFDEEFIAEMKSYIL